MNLSTGSLTLCFMFYMMWDCQKVETLMNVVWFCFWPVWNISSSHQLHPFSQRTRPQETSPWREKARWSVLSRNTKCRIDLIVVFKLNRSEISGIVVKKCQNVRVVGSFRAITWHACPHGWQRGWTSSSWCSAARPSLTPDPLSGSTPSTESLFWNVDILVCTKYCLKAGKPDGIGKVSFHIFIPEEQKAVSFALFKSLLNTGQVGTLHRHKMSKIYSCH